MLDPQVMLLAQQFAGLQKRISQLERNQRASMGPTSVAAGALTFTDTAGTPQLTVGQQPDGTFGAVSVTQQAPAQPDQPLAGPGILGIWMYWDGLMADGSAPRLDYAAAQVHVWAQQGFMPSTATLQGTLASAGLFGAGNLTAGTTYYVALVAVNQAGNQSVPSAYAQATAQSVPASIPPGSVSGLQMQTGTITAAQIAEEAGILGSQIAQNTITDGNIQAGTITANSIASNTITAQQITAGTITTGLLAAGIVVAGIVDGTTITGAQIIADGSSGEILAYSAIPAPGNLIASVSAAPGTDAESNPYLSGVASYANDGSGTFTQMAFGSVTLGNSTYPTEATGAGFAALQTNGSLLLQASGGGGAGVVGAKLLLNQDGTYQANGAMTGALPLVRTDTSVNSNANLVGANRLTAIWTIPANDAAAGTVYEIEMPWSCTMEGQSHTLGLSVDGSGTYTASDSTGGAIVSAGNGLNGTIRAYLMITATGTSGTYLAWVDGTLREQGGNALFSNSACMGQTPVTGSLNTTVSHNVRINSTWSAAATGQTVSGYGSVLTRKGP